MTRDLSTEFSKAVAAAGGNAGARLRARNVWLQIHLYLALICGAFIAVLGVTGSILTFHPEVDRLVTPSLRIAPSDAPRISAAAAAATIARELNLQTALIWMPREDNPVYVAEAFDPQQDVYRLVSVDPTSGEIVADRVWGRTVITFLFELHTSLLIGERGLVVVGCLAIVLILSILTGLYLWWPRAGTLAKALLWRPARSRLALYFELHRITGLYVAVVLLVVAFAGVYLALPGPVAAALGTFTQLAPDPESQPVLSDAPRAPDARPITLDEVTERVDAFARDSRIASIQLAEGPRDAYSVRYVDHGEPASRNGRSTVWIDQYSGRVLKAHAYSQLNTADRFLALQLPLHSGEILGETGRVLVCIAGLAIALLYITGLYLWWKRRRRRPAAVTVPD